MYLHIFIQLAPLCYHGQLYILDILNQKKHGNKTENYLRYIPLILSLSLNTLV